MLVFLLDPASRYAIVAKDEEKQKSIEEELAEDMMSLAASFFG